MRFKFKIGTYFLIFYLTFVFFFILISSFLDILTAFLSKISYYGNFSLIVPILNTSFYLGVILFYKIEQMLIRFW